MLRGLAGLTVKHRRRRAILALVGLAIGFAAASWTWRSGGIDSSPATSERATAAGPQSPAPATDAAAALGTDTAIEEWKVAPQAKPRAAPAPTRRPDAPSPEPETDWSALAADLDDAEVATSALFAPVAGLGNELSESQRRAIIASSQEEELGSGPSRGRVSIGSGVRRGGRGRGSGGGCP